MDDKLDKFERILNLVERARKLDFVAIEAMERLNKQNIDFYNFYTKITKEKNNTENNNYKEGEQTYTNRTHLDIQNAEAQQQIQKKANDMENQQNQQNQQDFTKEQLQAFMDAIVQITKKNTPAPAPASKPIPAPPHPSAHKPETVEPQFLYTKRPLPPPDMKETRIPLVAAASPATPAAASPAIPTASTTPTPSPAIPKDLFFIDKIRGYSSSISDRLKSEADILKQTQSAMTETHRMSFTLWKEIDEYLLSRSKNQTPS